MTWQRALLILVILAIAVAHYTLASLALRDVYRRPVVRGNTKLGWVLFILCVPFVGALVYGYMGAASFLPRVPGTTSDEAE